ncbi:MAG: phosphatase [Bacteroidetes bacterium]|nr:MAG: phosphatase [Bacteroidota bacterium]
MTFAILDFGTNTFNLLIAKRGKGSFSILHSGKEPVKLGRGGIQSNRLSPDAFERGFVAIQNHLEIIRQFEVDEIRAFATSAIRNASNGQQFVDEVFNRFGIRTRIVPGKREAELIYKGVRRAVKLDERKALILDIGGGSCEFILCSREGIIWKQSFEIGMARVLELFRVSDPISPEDVTALETWFGQQLGPLFEVVEKERPRLLIGASGTFDTIAELRAHRKKLIPDGNYGRAIPLKDFAEIHEALLKSTAESRRAMPGMEPVRVEMIVLASVFVSYVLRVCRIGELHHSAFALKEGVISELTGF